MKKHISNFTREEAGAAAVEFSIVLIPFLLFINFIIFYTIYSLNRSEVNYLSYLAEREITLYRSNEFCNVINASYEYALLEGIDVTCIENELTTYIMSNTVLLNQDQIDVAIDASCLATTSNPDCVRTVVSYQFNVKIPFANEGIDIISYGDGL